MTLKLVSTSLTKNFGSNKIYIWVNVIKLTQKFFGYDFLHGKVVWSKLTIYCPDSILANEIYIKRMMLMGYINKNLPKYYINIEIKEVKVVNHTPKDE